MFVNEWGYDQEGQSFLVSPQYTGNSYPAPTVSSGTVSTSDVFAVPTATSETVNNIVIPAAAFDLSDPALSNVKAANPGVTIGYTVRSTTFVNGVQETSVAVYTSKGGTLLAAAQENIG